LITEGNLPGDLPSVSVFVTIRKWDISSTVDSSHTLGFMEYRGVNAGAGVETDPSTAVEVGLAGTLGSNGFYWHLGFG